MSGRELQPTDVGRHHQVRFSDLRTFHALKAQCFACHHETLLAVNDLRRNWGDSERLVELETMLRCRRCRNREGNHLSVWLLPRNY